MGDVVKNGICTMVGVIGSLIASQFGGWDAALSTLILFMAVDYITGLVVAGVFHASPKSKDGTLESRAGWKGLCRKGETLLIVLVACRLDAVMGFHHRKRGLDGTANPGSDHQGRGHFKAALGNRAERISSYE